MCEQLLNEVGVALLPGKAFGRPESELTVRIAFVDFDGARALTAADKVPPEQELPDNFAETYCYNCVTAIDLICEWVNKLA